MTALIEPLGWTLVHSLWQGTLCWICLWMALRLVGKSAPRVRYLLGCTALAATSLLSVGTFIRLYWVAHFSGRQFTYVGFHSGSQSAAATNRVVSSIAAPLGFTSSVELLLPWIVLLWCLGCLWQSARLAAGFRAIRSLGKRARMDGAPSALQARVDLLAEQLALRRAVRLVETSLVDSPATLGWLKPLILIPVGAFSGMDVAQVDGVLAHELAHILRNDYLLNLIQSSCEVVYFFHPAVAAINRQIRLEREISCDEIAAEMAGDRRAYATALARMEEARVPDLALAAQGPGMLERLHRLLSEPNPRRSGSGISLPLTGGMVLLLLALASPALQRRLLAQAPDQGASQGASQSPFPQCPYTLRFFTSTPSWGRFRSGDSITIDAVYSDRPHTEEGGSYIVIGTYTLTSVGRARLGLSCTSEGHRGPGQQHHTPEDPASYTGYSIRSGSGRYTLKVTMAVPSRMHVAFSPIESGESFGTVYFDETKRDVEKAGPVAPPDLSHLPTSSGKPPQN